MFYPVQNNQQHFYTTPTSPPARPQPQTYTQAAGHLQNPIQVIAGTLFKLIGNLGHQLAGPAYTLAKNNPVLYGAGVAGFSMAGGLGACPYCGIMMAGMGAMGYINAQQQQQPPY